MIYIEVSPAPSFLPKENHTYTEDPDPNGGWEILVKGENYEELVYNLLNLRQQESHKRIENIIDTHFFRVRKE